MAVRLFQANDDYLLVEEVPPLLGKSRTEDWNVRQYWTQLEWVSAPFFGSRGKKLESMRWARLRLSPTRRRVNGSSIFFTIDY